mmetsp:Transcript_2345/g.9176  ORF Transcript_2345/g.9176 Transcript_2345/m.9176 type:complete len:217 (+) Transcript_2345:48-698(+)
MTTMTWIWMVASPVLGGHQSWSTVPMLRALSGEVITGPRRQWRRPWPFSDGAATTASPSCPRRGPSRPQTVRARDTPLLGCTPMNKTSRLRWWLTAEQSRCPQALTTTDSPLRMLAQGAGSWSRTTSSGTTLLRQSAGSGRGAGTTLPARQQAGWPNLATPASNRWAQGWGPGWPTTAYPSHLCRAPLTSRRLPRLEGSESPPTGPLTCSCRIQTQ